MAAEYQSEAEHAMTTRLQELSALKDERLADIDSLRGMEAQMTARLARLRRTIKDAGATLKIKRDPTPDNAEIDWTIAWCRKHYPEPAGTGARRLRAAAKEIDQFDLNRRNAV